MNRATMRRGLALALIFCAFLSADAAATRSGVTPTQRARITVRSGKVRPFNGKARIEFEPAGKRYGALFYAVNTLSGVPAKAALIGKEDKTPLDIPTDAFGTV